MSRQRKTDPDTGMPVSGSGDGGHEPRAQPKTPRERFLGHAVRRVTNAIHRMRQVRNMGNKATWEYTPVEAEKIMDAMKECYEEIVNSFTNRTVDKKVFTL